MSGHKKGRRQAGKGAPSRGRWKRVAVLLAGAMAILLVVASAFLIIPRLGGQSGSRAAIVDQLSLTFPNPDFVEAATETLEEAGYTVDYYPGEEVTVELYRRLPAHGYDVVILRVHSGRLRARDGTLTDDVILFTGEPFRWGRYDEEGRARVLAIARYFETDSPSRFFGLQAKFIESRMKGSFDGATVILMGCDGVRSSTMAEAFIRKGASAFISWDGLVSADHTDKATEHVLRHLLIDGLGTQEAVAQTVAEVGRDPAHGSMLLAYLSEE